MSRGELTDKVKKLSKTLFGYEIDVTELRLIPYIFHCITNSQNIDLRRVNQQDREILKKWKKQNYITSPASDLMVSSEFYEIMSKMLKVGYCSEYIFETE